MRFLPRLLATSLSVIVINAAKADTVTKWKGTSEIVFAGTSTLHSWSGKVNAQPFVAAVSMDAQGRPMKLSAEVQVKAAEMDTAEAKRDDNMHKDMKVDTYPLIIGKMDTGFDKIISDGRTPSILPFTLTILGKPQPVEGRIKNWSLKGDVATFDLDFDLSLKKCGIKVPSVLLVISVGDTIKLHAPVKLVRTAR